MGGCHKEMKGWVSGERVTTMKKHVINQKQQFWMEEGRMKERDIEEGWIFADLSYQQKESWLL